jgi:predicted enzyme related to lactoylglutathione lyase
MPSDPFDVLRRPTSAARPRPQFAIELRRRLEQELGMTTTTELPETVQAGQLRIIHMAVRDAGRALRFFQSLFGWEAETHEVDGRPWHYVLNTTTLTVLKDVPDAPPVRLWFTTADVSRDVRLLEELGGRVESAETGEDGGGWAECRDDQDLPIGLLRPGGYRETTVPSAPATGEVGYLTMTVDDTLRGRRFYEELLGWSFDPPTPNDYHHVGNAGMPLGLVGREAIGPNEPAVNLYFRVADIHRAIEAVRELGGEAPEPDESPSGLSCSCRDDQGTHFGLWQPAAGY